VQDQQTISAQPGAAQRVTLALAAAKEALGKNPNPMTGMIFAVVTPLLSSSGEEGAVRLGTFLSKVGDYILTGRGEDELRAVIPGAKL